MRVCHIITRFIRGGADENTLFSCNGQAQLNHEVHLIYGNEYSQALLDKIDKRVIIHKVDSLQRNISPVHDLRAFISITKLLREIRPDIVHTHTSKAGIIGRIAAHRSGVNAIIHGVHILPFVNVNIFSHLFYKTIELSVAGITDAFISVGDEMRQACINAGIGATERHYVVHSGMDINRFNDASRVAYDWKTVLPDVYIKPMNPRFLVLVSRLERRKGQLDLLPVFAELAVNFPDLVLLLVGEGPDRPVLEKEIAVRGLNGRVILTGFRQDVEKLMAIADIGLLTSVREGLARVLIQYSLMGLPIISTDIPGVRDIVIPNVTGYLTPPDNLSKMAYYIEMLLKDEKLRTKMSLERKKVDFSSWSIENMVTRLDCIYKDIVHKKHKARLD